MTGRAFRQENILTAIGPDRCLTTAEIAVVVERPHNKVADATCDMILSGLLERIERGCFRLTPEGRRVLESGEPIKSGPKGPLTGPRKPPRDSFRQRAWNAMRLMRTGFTTSDIIVRAAKGDECDPASDLGKWLRKLVAAGIVSDLGRRSFDGEPLTSNGRKVYRLTRDIGDIAPRVTQSGELIDLNREGAA